MCNSIRHLILYAIRITNESEVYQAHTNISLIHSEIFYVENHKETLGITVKLLTLKKRKKKLCHAAIYKYN